MIRCSVCNKENNDTATACVRCGVALVKDGIALRDVIELRVLGDERVTLRLETPQHEGYVIGRSDESSDYLPDVDLSAYGARQQGVSRRHAALVRYREIVHIIDLNSVNGTFLNDRKLLPDTPYPLNSGDSLKLGTFSLLIK